ncbi:MAG: carboxypeptidase regulatory-like domain-containing protein [Bacteroidota bacterium]
MSRLASLLTLALLLVAPAIAQTGTAEFFVPLRGDGDPEAGVAVTVTVYSEDPEGPTYEAVTDDTGAVRIEDVPDGTYYLFAAPSSEYLTLFSIPSIVGGEAPQFGFSFLSPLDPSFGTVRGRLTDEETGEPLRFDILLVNPEGQVPVGPITSLSSIDGEGNYAFQIAPGTYDLDYFIYSEGDASSVYRSATAILTSTAGETTTQDLALERRVPGIATGTVTDEATGAPLPGVPVLAYATDNTYTALTVTGPDGRYSIELPENDYVFQVDVSNDGYLQQFYDEALFFEDATTVTVPGEATAAGIDFSLVRPADDFTVSVSGRLVDSAGEPIENGTVSVYSSDNLFFSLLDVRAAPDGTFSLTTDETLLAGSRLALGFRAPGYVEEFFDDKPALFLADFVAIDADGAEVAAGDVELLLEGEDIPGFSISGTVTDEDTGAPLANTTVAVTRVDAPGQVFAVTDASGAYRADGLAEGEYVVLFAADEHAPEFYPNAGMWTEADPISVSSDVSNINALMGGLNRPVGVQRKGGAGTVLEGAVRTPEGAPLAGALVTARDQSGEAVAFALTSSSGRYTLEGLGLDPVAVSVDLPRFEPTMRPASAQSGGRLFLTLAPFVSVAEETTPDLSDADLQVYPNPTRGEASVAFSLPEGADVRVAVYDMLGREVAVVAEGARAEGTHTARLGTEAMAPGLYLVRVETAEGVQSVRFTVVR